MVIMGTGDEWSWCVGGCADGPDTACAPCAREHRWRAEFTRVQNALTVLENQWREATAREHKLRLAAERDRDEWKGLAQTLRVQESHMMGAVSDSGVPSGSGLVGLADATREVTRQRDEARICADTAEARVRELETRDRDRQERYENWLTELHDPLTAVAEAAQAYRKTSQRMYWCRLCDALDALAATGVIVTDSPPLYVLEKTGDLPPPKPPSVSLAGARYRAFTGVAKAAEDLIEAVNDCDREAERPVPSQSSVPMIRYINALTRLREALTALASTQNEVEPTTKEKT